MQAPSTMCEGAALCLLLAWPAYFLILQVGGVNWSKTPVNFYQTTWQQIQLLTVTTMTTSHLTNSSIFLKQSVLRIYRAFY
jgi:hypothetical protein